MPEAVVNMCVTLFDTDVYTIIGFRILNIISVLKNWEAGVHSDVIYLSLLYKPKVTTVHPRLVYYY